MAGRQPDDKHGGRQGDLSSHTSERDTIALSSTLLYLTDKYRGVIGKLSEFLFGLTHLMHAGHRDILVPTLPTYFVLSALQPVCVGWDRARHAHLLRRWPLLELQACVWAVESARHMHACSNAFMLSEDEGALGLESRKPSPSARSRRSQSAKDCLPTLLTYWPFLSFPPLARALSPPTAGS